MKCEYCYGFGRIVQSGYTRETAHAYPYKLLPCRECNGSGISHCCEGEQCQPVKDEHAQIEREIAEHTWGDKT